MKYTSKAQENCIYKSIQYYILKINYVTLNSNEISEEKKVAALYNTYSRTWFSYMVFIGFPSVHRLLKTIDNVVPKKMLE